MLLNITVHFSQEFHYGIKVGNDERSIGRNSSIHEASLLLSLLKPEFSFLGFKV